MDRDKNMLESAPIPAELAKLETIIIDNCPGLKTFNISGQNNQALNVNLVGA